jgi:hypothetical protein
MSHCAYFNIGFCDLPMIFVRSLLHFGHDGSGAVGLSTVIAERFANAVPSEIVGQTPTRLARAVPNSSMAHKCAIAGLR